MYAGKALVHLNDLVGGLKQFNMESDYITVHSLPSAENAMKIMRYNSRVTNFLLDKENAKTNGLLKMRNQLSLEGLAIDQNL